MENEIFKKLFLKTLTALFIYVSKESTFSFSITYNIEGERHGETKRL
jgi:hypothetical protein